MAWHSAQTRKSTLRLFRNLITVALMQPLNSVGDFQSENGIHHFAKVYGLDGVTQCATGFDEPFLSFGGCVRGLTQSAAMYIKPPYSKGSAQKIDR